MATDQGFADYILEQLRLVEGIRLRPMMGEYVLYCKERIAGGLYDGRLLIKPVPRAIEFFGQPAYVRPYPGAKELILVENIDDPDDLARLFAAIKNELPLPKTRKNKPKKKTERKKETE